MPKPKNKMARRKLADKLCSVFIRLRDRDDSGQGTCYTCNWKGSWRKASAGHFVPRQYLSVRYDEMNLASQCFACNMLYNGQPSAYAKRLEKDYGKGTVDLLESKRKEVIPDFDYEGIIEIYTEKLEQLGWNTKTGDWNL